MLWESPHLHRRHWRSFRKTFCWLLVGPWWEYLLSWALSRVVFIHSMSIWSTVVGSTHTIKNETDMVLCPVELPVIMEGGKDVQEGTVGETKIKSRARIFVRLSITCMKEKNQKAGKTDWISPHKALTKFEYVAIGSHWRFLFRGMKSSVSNGLI